MDKVSRVAPTLLRSRHLKGGWLLWADERTHWICVEGSDSAAVLLAPNSESNSDVLVSDVTMQLTEKSGFSMDIVISGEGREDTIRFLRDAEVVSPLDLRQLHDVEGLTGWDVFSTDLRRCLTGWERLGDNMYRRELTDSDGEDVKVLALLYEGRHWLSYSFPHEADGDLSQFADLTDGSHRVELFDTVVAVMTPLSSHISRPDEPDQLARDLVGYVRQKLAKLQTPSYEIPLPVVPSGAMWNRIETRYQGAKPGRDVSRLRAIATGDVLLVERIRETGEDEASFEQIEERGRYLLTQRGASYEYTARVLNGDIAVTPPWLSLKSVTVDPASGRVVGAGYLTHHGIGLSPAYNLGAINGSNGGKFADAGHNQGRPWPVSQLYVGSLGSGTLVPWHTSFAVESVDYHPGTEQIGLLEFLGSTTFAASVVHNDGRRQLLTVLDGLSGSESIRFSPNGAWLLITRYDGSWLIESATGRHHFLDVPNAAWWPAADSQLISVVNANQVSVPKLYDLSEARWVHEFASIRLDGHPVPDNTLNCWVGDAHPDGHRLLVMTTAGVTTEHREQHGSGHRVGIVDLETGASTLSEVFVDPGGTLEHDVRHAHFVATPPPRDVALHPTIRAQLREPVVQHEWLAPDRWAQEAWRAAVQAIDRAIDLNTQDRDPAEVLPEAVANLSSVRPAVDLWETVNDRNAELAQAIMNDIHHGRISSTHRPSWLRAASALQALCQDRPDLIDVVTASWAGELGTPIAPPTRSTAIPTPQTARPDTPSLRAGANVILNKDHRLDRLLIGLGWDVGTHTTFDLDASVLLLGSDDKVLSDQHFVFYGNPVSPDGAVRHLGDNRSGVGDGDDEQITLDLQALDPRVLKLVFAVSLYDPQLGQDLSHVVNAFIRATVPDTGRDLARYDLEHVPAGITSLVFGEVYRRNEQWKFRAVGQGYATGLGGLITDYGVQVDG